MPTPKFLNDLRAGQLGEFKVAQALQKIQLADSITHVDEGKAYDFILHFGDKKVTYEVKSDFMAAQTGNIFFEYYCNGVASGLSATQANKWAILLTHLNEIFLFEPVEMYAHLQTEHSKRNPMYRHLSGGDGKRASGYVVPIEVIRELPFVEVHSKI